MGFCQNSYCFYTRPWPPDQGAVCVDLATRRGTHASLKDGNSGMQGLGLILVSLRLLSVPSFSSATKVIGAVGRVIPLAGL